MDNLWHSEIYHSKKKTNKKILKFKRSTNKKNFTEIYYILTFQKNPKKQKQNKLLRLIFQSQYEHY